MLDGDEWRIFTGNEIGYGSVDTILDHFNVFLGHDTTAHAPCAVLYSMPIAPIAPIATAPSNHP